MSLDGFIAGRNDDAENPFGIKGDRLHDWLSDGGVDPRSHRPASAPSATVFDEVRPPGAFMTQPHRAPDRELGQCCGMSPCEG
jgi:hypothetical protein